MFLCLLLYLGLLGPDELEPRHVLDLALALADLRLGTGGGGLRQRRHRRGDLDGRGDTLR